MSVFSWSLAVSVPPLSRVVLARGNSWCLGRVGLMYAVITLRFHSGLCRSVTLVRSASYLVRATGVWFDNDSRILNRFP